MPVVYWARPVSLPGSGEVSANLWENLSRLRPRDELKFVLTDRVEFDWATDLVRRLDPRANRSVFFCPAWGKLDPAALADRIVESRLPVRLGLQIHKYIWGADARGR